MANQTTHQTWLNLHVHITRVHVITCNMQSSRVTLVFSRHSSNIVPTWAQTTGVLFVPTPHTHTSPQAYQRQYRQYKGQTVLPNLLRHSCTHSQLPHSLSPLWNALKAITYCQPHLWTGGATRGVLLLMNKHGNP